MESLQPKQEFPFISIVVPVYNTEKYLCQCVDSILNQTYPNIECILVDNGSLDNCPAICDGYAKKDPRVRVIHFKENQWISPARQAGMDVATGKYLMHVDSDDWLELDCCERVVKRLEETGCDEVIFLHCKEYENPRRTQMVKAKDSALLGRQEIQQLRRIAFLGENSSLGFQPRMVSARAFRREFLLKHGLKSCWRCEDVMFSLFLYEVLEKAYFDSYPGYHYRIVGTSTIHKHDLQAFERLRTYAHEFEEFVKQCHPNDAWYIRILGWRCCLLVWVLSSTYLFHKESTLSISESVRIMSEFLKDDVIRKYLPKCRIRDCKRIQAKGMCFLLKYLPLRCYAYITKLYLWGRNKLQH